MLEELFTELNIGPFYEESEISKKIRLLQTIPDLKSDSSVIADAIAFELLEDNQNRSSWGTYFGAVYSATTPAGEVFERPSISDINDFVIKHWIARLEQSKNPVLRARYSNLVWDFSKKISGESPKIEIARICINSLVLIVRERLSKNNISLISKIRRALSLSLSIKDSNLIKVVTNAIIELEEKIGKNDKPGLWGFSYDLLIASKIDLSEEIELQVISRLEQKLSIVTSTKEFYPRSAELIVTRLAKYYKTKRDTSEAQRVIKILGKAKETDDENRKGFQKLESLRAMQKLYSTYGLKKESEDTLRRIRMIGGDIHRGMKKITSTIEIPTKRIDEIVNHYTSGLVEEVFAKIINSFIPKLDSVKQTILDDSQKNPISYLISNSLFDSKGREVAKIGPLESDMEGHIYKQLSQQNQIMTTLYLNRIFDKIITVLGYTVDTFSDYIIASPVFEEERYIIIEKGIKAYFKGDYIVCNHILVPQFEEAIRNLIEINKGVVLKPSTSGGFHLKSLNELLNDDVFKITFNEDYQYYFKSIYTDSRGWNLRNNLCHGISSNVSFNRNTSERIIHSLLVLGCLSFD